MNKVVRISVSKLDSHRVWLTDAYRQDKSLEAYIDEIVNGSPENDAMIRGTVLHGILENGLEGDEVEYKGVAFSRKQVEPLLEWRAANPMETEVQLNPYYVDCVAGWRVAWSGRVDGIDSRGCVHDHKFPKSSSAYDKYFDSLQWRCYLEMTGMRQFQYNIFTEQGRKPNRAVRLKSVYTMTRERGAKDMLRDFTKQYFDFLMSYGLEKKLRNAQVQKAIFG